MSQRPQAPYLFPEGARLGTDNVVLHARATCHRVEGYAGPLSVKTVLSGRVAWIIGGRELIVDRSSILILSAGETYSMNIAALRPVETCCAFFAPGFVERVALDMTSPLEPGLALPDRVAPELPYLSALHRDPERALATRVQTLAQRCRGGLVPGAFEEDFLMAAAELLRFYRQIGDEAERIPAIRKSTDRSCFAGCSSGVSISTLTQQGQSRLGRPPELRACRHSTFTEDSRAPSGKHRTAI